MLLIERLFAGFTIWLCNLCDVTQTDVDRLKEREFGIRATPQHPELIEVANRSQLVIRFRR